MQSLSNRPLTQPHPARLDPADALYDEVCARHARAMAHGEDGYLDPRSGLFVMTAAYLAGRGTCCSSGCRHCPYVE